MTEQKEIMLIDGGAESSLGKAMREVSQNPLLDADGNVFVKVQGTTITNRPDGLHAEGFDKKGNAFDMVVGGPISVTAVYSDLDSGGGRGIVVEFQGTGGKTYEKKFLLTQLVKSKLDSLNELVGFGYWIPVAPGQFSQNYVCDFLLQVGLLGYDSLPQAHVVRQGGWVGDSYTDFAFPEGVISADNKTRFMVDIENPFSDGKTKGTLEDWQQKIAEPALLSRSVAMDLCAAFAAPLLRPVGAGNIGANCFGDSSAGKSTGLYAAASVMASADVSHGYISNWNETKNSLAGEAESRNDVALIIDEMGQADARMLRDMAYLLGNGIGRGRSDRGGKNKRRSHFSIVTLSCAENSFAELREGMGEGLKAGESVRMVDIPAICRDGSVSGVLDMRPDWATAAMEDKDVGTEYTTRIQNAARTECYGVAGREFVRYIIRTIQGRGLAGFRQDCKVLVDGFAKRHSRKNDSPKIGRILRSFAMLALGGELATDAGILPWQPGQASGIISRCVDEWRGSESNPEALTLHRAGRIVEAFAMMPTQFDYVALDDTLGLKRAFSGKGCDCLGLVVKEYADGNENGRLCLYVPNGAQFDNLLRKLNFKDFQKGSFLRDLKRLNQLALATNDKEGRMQLKFPNKGPYGLPKGRYYCFNILGLMLDESAADYPERLKEAKAMLVKLGGR